MLPIDALLKGFGDAAAADATWLAGNLTVALIKSPFTPGQATLDGLVAGDQADFDGYAQKAAAAATRKVDIDPATGDILVTILPPAGGWRWETTGDTHLPETIYGAALLQGTVGAIFPDSVIASEVFNSSVTFTGHPQQLVVPEVKFRIPNGAIN